jgi:hypothetical protein
MADIPKPEETPKPEEAVQKPVAKEQTIDPWSVEAATDEQGNIVSFDYDAISRCAQLSRYQYHQY